MQLNHDVKIYLDYENNKLKIREKNDVTNDHFLQLVKNRRS